MYEVIMEFYIIPDEEALSMCTWCQSHIIDHMEVLGLGAKLKPDADLSEYENHCIQKLAALTDSEFSV